MPSPDECTAGLRLGEGSLDLLTLDPAGHPLRHLDQIFSPTTHPPPNSHFFLKAQQPILP